MGHRNVGDRREIEVEELARNPEDSFAQLLELEIRFDFVLVQIVFALRTFSM